MGGEASSWYSLMKHSSLMTDFRAPTSLLAPEGRLKRGECFLEHVSAAGDERTPAVITTQYRLNHEGHSRDFQRCFRNRHLRACSPFTREQLSASTKNCVTELTRSSQIFTNISSTFPLFGTAVRKPGAVFSWYRAGVIA